MKIVTIDATQTQFQARLAAIEAASAPLRIWRQGLPVADFARHAPAVVARPTR